MHQAAHAERRPARVHRLQQAAQRQRHDEQGADDHLDHGQAHARGGVVGGALMGFQRDGVAERRRHGAAVGGDVPHVAPRQPQAQRGGQDQGGEEQRGEGGGHCRIMKGYEL
jgi:hypothetical protein